MKRIGRVRECDAPTLSGRPSFTISTWGEALKIPGRDTHVSGVNRRAGRATIESAEAIHGEDALVAAADGSKGVHAGPTVEEQTTIATGIYGGPEHTLLAHIWPVISQEGAEGAGADEDEGEGEDTFDTFGALPSIRGSPGKRARSGGRRQTLRGAPAPPRNRGSKGNYSNRKKKKKPEVVDQFSARGNKFRASFAGTGFNTHTAINMDGMTPAMIKHYKEQQAEQWATMCMDTSKVRWNPDPHYRCLRPRSGCLGRGVSAKKRVSRNGNEADYTKPDAIVQIQKREIKRGLHLSYGSPLNRAKAPSGVRPIRRKKKGHAKQKARTPNNAFGIEEESMADIIAEIEAQQGGGELPP